MMNLTETREEILFNHKHKLISKRRLIFLLSLTILLCITNPANTDQHVLNTISSSLNKTWNSISHILRRKKRIPKKRSKRRFNQPLWDSITLKETNYGIFTLYPRPYGVTIGFLSHITPLCFFDGKFPTVCSWISSNVIHDLKMFRDISFTALRFLQMFKLGSYGISWCYYHSHEELSSWYSPSVLHPSSSLVRDWISMNFFLYPMFQTVDVLTSQVSNSKIYTSIHFISTILFILIVIGEILNRIASHISKHHVIGMNGSIAASLGYIFAASEEDFSWFRWEFDSSDIFQMILIISLVSSMMGVRTHRFLTIIIGVLGFILGNFFGQLQMEMYGM